MQLIVTYFIDNDLLKMSAQRYKILTFLIYTTKAPYTESTSVLIITFCIKATDLLKYVRPILLSVLLF